MPFWVAPFYILLFKNANILEGENNKYQPNVTNILMTLKLLDWTRKKSSLTHSNTIHHLKHISAPAISDADQEAKNNDIIAIKIISFQAQATIRQ